MNEGENSGMPNGPIFSSPNIAGSQPQPQQAPVPMPEQPVDVTKTDNPTLTTTIAAMPEQDGPLKPTVTSGGDAVDKKKPRFGLGTRRFKEKTQTPAAPIMQAAQPTAFANAPEFFNDAVGDIVLADAAETEKKNKIKKFTVIGGIAAALVVVAIVVVSIFSSILVPKTVELSKVSDAISTQRTHSVLEMEKIVKSYATGEYKLKNFCGSETKQVINDGFDDLKNIELALKDADNIKSGNNSVDVKAVKEDLSKDIALYDEIVSRYNSYYSYIVDGIKDSTFDSFSDSVKNNTKPLQQYMKYRNNKTGNAITFTNAEEKAIEKIISNKTIAKEVLLGDKDVKLVKNADIRKKVWPITALLLEESNNE